RILSSDLLAGRQERPALYAARCNREMARREGGAPAHMPPVVRPPEALRGTAEAGGLPAAIRGAVGERPFGRAPGSAPPPAPGHRAHKTLRSNLGGTMPDGDAIQKAVAAVPFTGDEGMVGVVSFPSLTVRQYVSLRSDLATRPSLRAETLRSYGVPTEASWRA